MPQCRYVNQDGVRCCLAYGHGFDHTEHLDQPKVNVTKRNLWNELPVPTFNIKASDPFAGACIRLWCALAGSYNLYKGPTAPRVPNEKVIGAQQRLSEFLKYQADYGTKLPD